MIQSSSKIAPDERLVHEVEHGKKIAGRAGRIWNWESPAGKLRWKRRTVMLGSNIRPGMNVLEIGCGTGYYTRELLKTEARITALDISPDLIRMAEKDIQSDKVVFRIENAYEMSFEDKTFDAVIGSSVLHHLEIDKAIKEIFRVLKPGGIIRFTEPNMLNPQIALEKNIPFIKRRLGDSLDETAFFRWKMKRLFLCEGFKDVVVDPFDFLHPSIPKMMLPFMNPLCNFLEALPFLREIAGSLSIEAEKPASG